MPPDVMARLNDDAAVRLRADESGQGSGSGFRSARRLVEALSGSLRIAASSAEGTTIRIALPCAFAGVTPCTAEELQAALPGWSLFDFDRRAAFDAARSGTVKPPARVAALTYESGSAWCRGRVCQYG